MPNLTLDQAMEIALRHAQAGRMQQAEEIYRQVLNHAPDHAEAWNNLGIVLRQTGRLDQALDAFMRSVEIQPDRAEAVGNLGNALREVGRLDDALAAHQRSAGLQPDSADAFNNLADTHKARGEYEPAIAHFRRAVALEPDNATYHHHLGITLLLTGNFTEGWTEHECRCRVKQPRPICLDFPQPRWNGEELNGKTILLHAEQGLGDTIQFVRYAPMVRSRGGKVILQCQPELHRLLSAGGTVPPFDVHCPLMSLPKIFGINAQSIPYIRADEELASQWRDRLPSNGKKKIGLVWAGRRQHSNDRNRSISPELLEPILQLTNVDFISLQKGEPALDCKVLDWTGQLHDFADTAALVHNLDLIVTIDSAVAHLAGAMGKPVWVLIPFVPDWRWLIVGEDTPWYPTIRLFRQQAIGDWKTPIQRIADELGKQS